MSRAAPALASLLLLGWGLVLVTAEQEPLCRNITIPLCLYDELGYNLTRMPNLLGHDWQDEAGLEVHQFFPLVKVGCSKNLKPFLCLLYVPECEADTNDLKPPCRELCEDARDGCEPLMMKFGFSWPESMDCTKFPSAAAGEACGLPAGSNLAISAPTPPPPSVELPRVFTQHARPSEPGCRCGEGSAAPGLAALEGAMERLVGRSTRLHQLQQETLQMQQQNMRLERRKLELEIRLLQRQLRGN